MRRTVTWILYILMGVQIAFGCAYFVSNFGTEQQFQENMASFLPMGAVCLLQIMLAAVSTWYVLGKTGFRENRYLRGYVCAFLLTVPFLLQMHMARLVWSVSLSCFLWMLGLLLEILKSGLSTKRIVEISAVYALYGMICPDGLWLGGILLLALLFFQKKSVPAAEPEKQGGGKLRFVIAAILTAGVVFAANRGLNNAFLQERAIYRENDPGMIALSRFVWPNFGANYYFWPETAKEILPVDDAVEISIWADMVGEKLYFPLEKTYGKKGAAEICLRMAGSCLEYRTRETVTEIGRDLRDIFLLPFTIERNLKGDGVSLTAWNYGRMKAHTPVLVKYYYRYGLFELPFLLLGSILLWGMQGSERTRQFLRQKTAGQKCILFIPVCCVIWYTMRSNFPIDYKRALPVLFFWYMASVGGLLCQKAENRLKEYADFRKAEEAEL